MLVVLASVHHTGTNFIFQHLLKGRDQLGMNSESYRGANGKSLVRIHCDIDQYEYLSFWREKGQLVVPMRHPEKVAESWLVREKPLDILGHQWEILKREVAPYDPVYLPLDVPERDKWLDRLADRLETKLQTDWPVIMSRQISATLSDAQRDQVAQWMSDGFFDRFGYEI